MYIGGGYWVITFLNTMDASSGGILREAEAIQTIHTLGYPVYFMFIIGTWKIFGVTVILIPKFKLIKEWAYAGFFFVLSGAALTHIIKDGRFSDVIKPLFFLILTIISWYFRPIGRKIITSSK